MPWSLENKLQLDDTRVGLVAREVEVAEDLGWKSAAQDDEATFDIASLTGAG